MSTTIHATQARYVHQPKNFDHLLGKTKFSDELLKDHFTLYQGYVKKLNEVSEKLSSADRSAPNYSFNDYSELKRREPVPYNGTVLHELYFENLAEPGKTRASNETKEKLEEAYGSVEAWIADMKAACLSAPGWALTVWDPLSNRLRTDLVSSEHHVGVFANTKVIIAFDGWEHAYARQFGIKKADYVTAFFESLNWASFDKRL
jgi:superoxide dismutase, Fe-Mn family